MNRRAEIVRRIAKDCGVSQRDVQYFLRSFIRIFREMYLEGEDINLTGAFRLEFREVPEHVAWNPKTGQKLIIPTWYKPYFYVTSTLARKYMGKMKRERKPNRKYLDEYVDFIPRPTTVEEKEKITEAQS